MSDPIEAASALTQYGPIGITAFIMLVGICIIARIFIQMTQSAQKKCDEERERLAKKLEEREIKHEATLAGYGMEMQKTAAQCSAVLASSSSAHHASAEVTTRVMNWLERERQREQEAPRSDRLYQVDKRKGSGEHRQ
jgi:hypothetical protein